MNELLVIVRQIVIMFLLMSVGFFIYKKKMIDDHSTKQLTDIVLYVVNPALSLVDIFFLPSLLFEYVFYM